jgi:hypothetical protein
MAKVNGVGPVRRHGYWYGARNEQGKHGQQAGKNERVLLFCYGKLHYKLRESCIC